MLTPIEEKKRDVEQRLRFAEECGDPDLLAQVRQEAGGRPWPRPQTAPWRMGPQDLDTTWLITMVGNEWDCHSFFSPRMQVSPPVSCCMFPFILGCPAGT